MISYNPKTGLLLASRFIKPFSITDSYIDFTWKLFHWDAYLEVEYWSLLKISVFKNSPSWNVGFQQSLYLVSGLIPLMTAGGKDEKIWEACGTQTSFITIAKNPINT
jgi:hypothetical protein